MKRKLTLLIFLLPFFVLEMTVCRTTFAQTIDTVTDIGVHTATGSTNDWLIGGSATGTFYNSTTTLTDGAANQAEVGSATFNKTIDWSKDFNLTATLNFGSAQGDSVGVIFAPNITPQNITTGVGGAGLGLWGLASSFGLIADMYANDGYSHQTATNPNMGDFTNDINGSILLGSANGQNPNTATTGTLWGSYSNGMTGVAGDYKTATANGGGTSSKTEQYISWRYTRSNGYLLAVNGNNKSTTYLTSDTNPPPSGSVPGNAVASIGNKTSDHTWTLTYTVSNTTLTIVDSNNAVSPVKSNNQYFGANTDAQTWTLNVSALKGSPTSLTFIGSQSSGSSSSQSPNKFTAKLPKAYSLPITSRSVTVNYVDTYGNVLKNPTTISNVDYGSSIGLTGLTSNQTYMYDAPSIANYTAVSANALTVTTATTNTINIVYAKFEVTFPTLLSFQKGNLNNLGSDMTLGLSTIDQALVITDTFPTKNAWQLQVSLSTPFQNGANVLNNILYINNIQIGNQAITVANGPNSQDTQTILSDNTGSIELRIPANTVVAQGSYTGVLTWTLNNTP